MKKALTIFFVLLIYPTTGFSQSTMSGAVSISGSVRVGRVLEVNFDTFHGLSDKPCIDAPTSRFRIEKIGSRWILCTPNTEADGNNQFWSSGVYNIITSGSLDDLGERHSDRAIAKYGDKDVTWCPQQVLRIKKWFMNTLAEFALKWCSPDETHASWLTPGNEQPHKLPYVPILTNARDAYRNVNEDASRATKDLLEGVNTTFYTDTIAPSPDLWDAEFKTFTNSALARFSKIGTSPWILGVTIGETDTWFGFGAGDPLDVESDPAGKANPHLGWIILAGSPLQTGTTRWQFNVGGGDVFYPTTEVFSKSQLKTFLEAAYATIGDLNTAWGSSYSTFGTAGTDHTAEQCDILGNGSKTVFTCTLANTPVTKESVLMKRAGTAEAGGDGEGLIVGLALSVGTITHATGAVSVTFVTPPTSGQAITFDYVTGGWGSGSGLMDEDGRNTSWMGITANTPWISLTGLTSAMKTDLNDFLFDHADKGLCDVNSGALDLLDSNVLHLGLTVNGSWRAPPRGPILQAAGQAGCVDVLNMTFDGSLEFGDFVFDNAGDVPIMSWEGFVSNPDSGLFRYAQGGGPLNYANQPARGQGYRDALLGHYEFINTAGNRPVIGFKQWEYVDNWGEKANWGMISVMDNSYDGFQGDNFGCTPGDPANCTACTDPDGIEDDPIGEGAGTVVNCGAEETADSSPIPFGNFIGFVKDANRELLRRLLAEP